MVTVVRMFHAADFVIKNQVFGLGLSLICMALGKSLESGHTFSIGKVRSYFTYVSED